MPEISTTRIANMALSHIGARSTIENLSEESPEAKQAILWYDYSRIQALEFFNWSFARKRLTLTVHSEAAPEGVWGFRYQYPADCIIARELENPASGRFSSGIVGLPSSFVEVRGDAIPFSVEMASTGKNKTILTDLEDATLIYTFDQQEVSLFSGLFVEMLSHLLAHHIAFALTGKRSIAVDELQKFQGLLQQAPAVDANEQVAQPPRDAEWVRGRW